MINITPTSHYSTNFKAKTDYSKIYKEMERITLVHEEKIMPKISEKKSDEFLKKIAYTINKLNQFNFKWKKPICPNIYDFAFDKGLLPTLGKSYDYNGYVTHYYKFFNRIVCRSYLGERLSSEWLPSGRNRIYEKDPETERIYLHVVYFPNGRIIGYDKNGNITSESMASSGGYPIRTWDMYPGEKERLTK